MVPRITPACAGKTRPVPFKAFIEWDHPRVCGKDLCRISPIRWFLGSPPRVRERPCLGYAICSMVRITPACAGKTIYAHPVYDQDEDHPRVCGKDWMAGRAPALRKRITPACAGKTGPAYTKAILQRDHPRVCGKDEPGEAAYWGIMGSPPRVRERRTCPRWPSLG